MKKILAIIFIVLGTGFAFTSEAAISIVQSTQFTPSATQCPIPLTLKTQPAAGDVLVAFTQYSFYGDAGRYVTPPDGTWTLIGSSSVPSGNDVLASWWKVASSSATTTYTFNVNECTDWSGGLLFEMSGVNPTTPIDQNAFAADVLTPATYSTPSSTPTVVGDFAFGMIAPDLGSTNGMGASSVSSGWALGTSSDPSYHSLFSAYRTSNTTSTSNAISVAFTLNQAATGGNVRETLLLRAATSTPLPPVTADVIFTSGVTLSNGVTIK